MTPRFRVTPAADRDLDAHAEYLARAASLDTAFRFYAAAATTFEKIARMPGIVERRETHNPELATLRVARVEGFEQHMIFYRATGEGIDVIRVLHGARDIDRILTEMPGEDRREE